MIKKVLSGYFKFRSSLYGRVIFVISLTSILLFLTFGVIFRGVNEKYIKNVIQQSGNNIAYLVEGSIYHAMLENDKESIQSTLEIMNVLPGISDVNLYDTDNNLVYAPSTEFSTYDSIKPHRSDCKACHADFAEMFLATENSNRIINTDSNCEMNMGENTHRHLFIKSPILNQAACYTNECHAHSESDVVLGSLIIKIPLEGLDAALEESTGDYFLLAAIMTGLLLFTLVLITGREIKVPLKAIRDVSESVAAGDMTARLELRDNELEDIRLVSTAFNRMIESVNSANLELQNWSLQLEYKVGKKTDELQKVYDELIHVERIASLGKLASSVAHEINNPLSGILTYTKLIQKQLSDPNLEDSRRLAALRHLKVIETETKRCGDIVKGLLDFSKKDQQNYEVRNLHRIINETYELMSHPMKISNIKFSNVCGALSDRIFCSPNQIKQAFVAILQNASEAVNENGEVTIVTSNPDKDSILVEVTDNGSGISPDDLPHIFEPFFSAKNKASGVGLGLAIVHGIVQSHNGKVEVKSVQGEKTIVSVMFPLYNESNDK